MFLKVDGELVNLENVRNIDTHYKSVSAGPRCDAQSVADGVDIYFVNGSVNTYSISMEEIIEALTELGVML